MSQFEKILKPHLLSEYIFSLLLILWSTPANFTLFGEINKNSISQFFWFNKNFIDGYVTPGKDHIRFDNCNCYSL